MTSIDTAKRKPYGCAVTVDIRTGAIATRSETFHWRGSEASCRKKAMLKTGAVRISDVELLDEETYIRAYGKNQRM